MRKSILIPDGNIAIQRRLDALGHACAHCRARNRTIHEIKNADLDTPHPPIFFYFSTDSVACNF